MRRNFVIVAAMLASAFEFAASSDGRAQDRDAGAAASKDEAPASAIQWFATWDQCRAESKRTNRPILLVAAAPHCHEISGLW